ncbi:MAG: hypothetical protein ACR2PK_16370 [Acidimicrobiales bacterium]
MARSMRVPARTRSDPALVDAMMQWQAAAVRQESVDPITTELVRLRCAQHHDCHT